MPRSTAQDRRELTFEEVETGRTIVPHGSELLDLMADPERAAELRASSRDWPSWELTDYAPVCAEMRLASGTLWPIPIVLDLPETLGRTLGPGRSLALRDAEGVMLAALHVEDAWAPDGLGEAATVYGLQAPIHFDYRGLRRTPRELRAEFARLGDLMNPSE